jgi:hypothetical protein
MRVDRYECVSEQSESCRQQPKLLLKQPELASKTTCTAGPQLVEALEQVPASSQPHKITISSVVIRHIRSADYDIPHHGHLIPVGGWLVGWLIGEGPTERTFFLVSWHPLVILQHKVTKPHRSLKSKLAWCAGPNGTCYSESGGR